jgi:hypothetical protein
MTYDMINHPINQKKTVYHPIHQKKKRKGETIVVKGTLYWYG